MQFHDISIGEIQLNVHCLRTKNKAHYSILPEKRHRQRIHLHSVLFPYGNCLKTFAKELMLILKLVNEVKGTHHKLLVAISSQKQVGKNFALY